MYFQKFILYNIICEWLIAFNINQINCLKYFGLFFNCFFVLEKLRKAMPEKAQSCSNTALRFVNQNGKKYNLKANKIYGANVLIYLICRACSSIALFAAVQSKFLKVKWIISQCNLNSLLGLKANLVQLRQIWSFAAWNSGLKWYRLRAS